jgi:hypothetical protein
MGGDLPDYSRKVIVVYEGTITGGEVKCDHWKIKGLTLKDPYIALSIPMSVENPALAYDAVTDRFKIVLEAVTAGVIPVSLSTLLNPHPVSLASIPNPSNLDVALSTRATGAILNPHPVSLSSIPNPSNLDIAISLLSRETTLAAFSAKITNPLPVSLSTLLNPHPVSLSTLLNPHPVTQTNETLLKSTVTQAAKDRTVTGTLTQSTKHDAQTFLSARIDTATGTTNVAVVAAQGAGNKIYVIGYQLQAKGDVEAVLRSASTDLSPEWDFNAREGVVAPICNWPAFYFVTAANEALNIYLDAAIRVTGNVQYVVST